MRTLSCGILVLNVKLLGESSTLSPYSLEGIN